MQAPAGAGPALPPPSSVS